MSKLLLDEAPLQVQPSLATAIGLNEAIALQQLHWVASNPNMGKTVDGRKYVHMSYAEWRKGHFPFWSEATIQRTFSALEDSGLVQSRDDLNTLSFDRTKWYAIDLDEVEKVEKTFAENERVIEHRNMKDGHRKMKNASSQPERTIPESSSSESSSESSSSFSASENHAAPAPQSDDAGKKEFDSLNGVSADEITQAKSAHRQMLSALSEVCQIDLSLCAGKYGKEASRLVKAGYTAPQVKEYYARGAEWYRYDWRGQKGQPPDIRAINETIQRAVSGAWKEGGGASPGKAASILRAFERYDEMEREAASG